MALNFPSNPSENDVYQFGLLTYIFKNGKWVSQSRGASQLPWYSNMEQARALWKRLAAEAGLNLVDGSFEEGAEVTSSSDVVWWQAGSAIYSWHLNEAKTVPTGSTPATSGGIGSTAWVDRTDSTLRSQIADLRVEKLILANGPSINVGSASPEGAVTASPGSIYMCTAGGAATSFYVKESGTGNTGWVAK